MITIEVDKKACKGDGRCVELCPMLILRMNKEGVPEFVPGGQDMCINCGHCFACCPRAAIKLSTMDPREATRIDPDKLPGPEQAELFLKARRSVRVYKDEPLAKEVIEKLLDIARYAPSGINRQPVNWLVIIDKSKVHDLGEQVRKWMEGMIRAKSEMAQSLSFDRLIESWNNGQDRICRSAPAMAVAYGVKDDPMVPQSCLIAGTYLELAAFGLGLGACWAGYVNMAINTSDEVRKAVGLSSRAFAGAVMLLGYPKYRYSRVPGRNPAKIIWK